MMTDDILQQLREENARLNQEVARLRAEKAAHQRNNAAQQAEQETGDVDAPGGRQRQEGIPLANPARHPALLEALPDLLFLQNREGVYLDYHAIDPTTLLIPPEQFLDRRMVDVLPPDMAAMFTAAMQRALQTREPQILEYLAFTPGPKRYFEARLWAYEDDKVVSILRDITERKRAEEALKESENRFRAAIEGSFDAFALLTSERDAQGRIVDFVFADLNRNAEHLLLASREQLLGQRLCELFPNTLNSGFFEKFVDVVERREPLEEEFCASTSEAAGPWLHMQVVPVNDGIAMAGRDVTARKRLEADLLQAQKMESIGRLAGGVAHDFNNLLTAIQGFAELAAEEAAPESTLAGYLANVQAASGRAAELTSQLLAFARKQIIEPKLTDLNTLVRDTEKILRRLLGAHIELATVLLPGLWGVRVDPGQFQQILINLAINAQDAMESGGKLTIETINITLDAMYTQQHSDLAPGDYVMVVIRDTGVGMPEEVKAHIFEPFFTTKERGKGTGLGLATCYGIVKQNGGHISLYSAPGQGTTFKIYLPRMRDCDTPAESEKSSAPMPKGTETILLVEDEPMVREIAAQTIRAQGYTVLIATNGAEALRLAASDAAPIHLMVTDIVMPEMNGKQLADRLQQERPDLKVLYISGYTDNSIVHHGVLDEDIAFLQKPFTMTALAGKVREMLDMPTS